MARIVLLAPVVEAPVILHASVVVEIALGDVPLRCFLFARRAVGERRQLGCCEGGMRRLSVARIGGILLPEGEIDAVDGTRLLPDETAQVDGVVIPLVDILRAVFVQVERFLIDEATGATQFVGGFGRVALEESQHILLEDAHHAEVYGIEIGGAERNAQALGVGQDGGIRQKLHLRFEVLFAEGERVRRAEFPAFCIADAFVQEESQLAGRLLRFVGICQDFIGFHLEDGVLHFPDFHQTFQILRGVQRRGKHDFQSILRRVYAAGGEEAEVAAGGYEQLQTLSVVDVCAGAVCRERQRVVFLFAGDAVQREGVAQRVVGGREADGDFLAVGGEHLLHRIGVDGVAQADFAGDGQMLRRGDDGCLRLHREGARLHAEGEAELLQSLLHRQETAQAESGVIEGAGLQFAFIRREFDGAVVQPAGSSPEGGGEAEGVVLQLVQVYHGEVLRQLHADGAARGEHAARIGADVGSELGGGGDVFPRTATSGEQRDCQQAKKRRERCRMFHTNPSLNLYRESVRIPPRRKLLPEVHQCVAVQR